MTNKEYKKIKRDIQDVAAFCYQNSINAMPFIRSVCSEKFGVNVKFEYLDTRHSVIPTYGNGKKSELKLVMVRTERIDLQDEFFGGHTGEFEFAHCSLKWDDVKNQVIDLPLEYRLFIRRRADNSERYGRFVGNLSLTVIFFLIIC